MGRQAQTARPSRTELRDNLLKQATGLDWSLVVMPDCPVAVD